MPSWKLKAHTLALLSRIPAGSRLYHWLQRVAGTNRIQPGRDLQRAYEIVELIQEAGGTVAGSTFLEIGTGWRPFVPLVLALGGAKRVVTLDVNPWLTLSYARETWESLELAIPEIAVRTGQSEADVKHRYRRASRRARTLKDLLEPLGIDYLYPADARSTGLEENSIDGVVSSNVLEHIPRNIQEAIHRESLRVLRPGGLAVHRFNPQDHYSTVDMRLTNGNFLQFSSSEWHWYGGSGLAYHNRLRSRDYRELLQQTGFEISICRERVDERTADAIRSGTLPVHAEFRDYTIEELSVDYMWMACRKPVVASPRRSASPRGLVGSC